MAIQAIINQQNGPLPIKAVFTAPGDEPMYLEVSGSIWSGSANCLIGIQIKVDDQDLGAAQIFSNDNATHRATVPAYLPIQLTPGQHTLYLTPMTGTTMSDQNDFYTAVIHY